ncbi:phytoene desaturase family protein [Thermoflexus sp.]|uniref:phytoene desaturase family protein n=1 Tax=Thermoflexus sp. TaxID=1969742 RepID=UPI0035E43A63
MGEVVAFDVVVAGGGHNGLACAAYLAKAGLRVLVVEGREVLGGDTTTEELTVPGFRHDPCATAFELFQSSPTIRNDELDLRRRLRFLHPDPVVTMPFDDGTSLTMWRDRQRTAAEIARFSRRDAEAYLELLAEYDQVKEIFNNHRYTPIGYGPSLEERLAERPNGGYWKRRYRQSALEVIQEYFEDDHVRAFMLWLAFMTLQPVDRPYTGRLAYALPHGRQANSWTLPAGGAGTLPAALATFIREHGGEIRTGEWVTELLIEGGRCVGVRTAAGHTYRARHAVVSSIHIKHLVEMAPASAWGEEFRRGVAQWQAGFTMFVAHYALREPPLYPLNGERVPVATAGIAGSVDNLLRLMSDFQRGQLHLDTPVLLVLTPSVVDRSRAPEGGHTLKVVSFLPYELADGGPSRWDTIKEEVAQQLFDYLCRFAPNLREELIIGRYVESPLDLERRNPHNWHGTCHGGDLSPAQSDEMRPVPGWASHRMPIPGLYQTGATTHPGGSVTAGPGRNAAWVLLDDLGMPAEAILKTPPSR